MRIVFAGTPHFADTALHALLTADPSLNFNVVGIFTQPDRPAGRGMKLTASPVKQTALAYGIPVFQPRSLKLNGNYPDDAITAETTLQTLAPDVMVVAAYGLILPQWTLTLPRMGCVNIHASLLPRWRGAAPIQRAIQAGDTESGVCLMQMEAGLDTGAIYTQHAVAITSNTTGGQLHDALSAVGATMLCQHLPAIVAGKLIATPQNNIGINYAHKVLREQGALDWTQTASILANQVRAFDPTHGCHFEHGGQIYKVWAAQALPTTAHQLAGSILGISEQGLDIACSVGILRITEIQKSGGKRLPIKACWQALNLL
jgi:methionyl-tRNA formyltransferase